jgi:hypothetical protein
LAALL